MSDDGSGIVVGDKNAPAKIDIFMEPQCPHCADFNTNYGVEIVRHIEDGALQVTYRPLTFFDEMNKNDYSKRAANAMFLAATPNSGTSPPAFVRFMTSLYNPTGDGLPDDAEMARSAERSDIPSQVVDRIAAKDTGVDVVKMAEVNNKLLTAPSGTMLQRRCEATTSHQMITLLVLFRRCTTSCISPLFTPILVTRTRVLVTWTGSTT